MESSSDARGVSHVSEAAILAGLRALGVEAGDRVLVHSSLSRLGYVEGGAPTVIRSLLAAVGSRGTLLLPTLTGKPTDGPSCPPEFDLRQTPSWTGVIPETGRRWPGARRSLHPTHSVVALGAEAADFVAGHEECRLPCGEGSPWVRLARAGGKLIFFGVTLDCNTTFHAAEELAGVPYHLQEQPTRCQLTDGTGRVIEREYILHRWGTPRRFAAMADRLHKLGVLRQGRIGDATVLVVDDGPMLDYTVNLLREDPWALACH